MKIWYAVQETNDDAWDCGSFDYNEALEKAMKIAKENGTAIIAYIDDDHKVCIDEEVITA